MIQSLLVFTNIPIAEVSGFSLGGSPFAITKKSVRNTREEHLCRKNHVRNKIHICQGAKTANSGLSRCYSTTNDDDMNSKSSSANNNNVHLQNPITLNWNLSSLLARDPETQPKIIALMDVYNAAVQQLQSPESLDYTGELSPSLAPLRIFCRKYSSDMGHDGRFSIFSPTTYQDNCDDKCKSNEPYDINLEENGGSLQANVVFSMDNPLKFIREALSCEENDNNDRTDYDSETVIFIPGLHTLHELKNSHNSQSGRQRTSTDRVKYYSRVLEGMPIAQLHAGSYYDQRDVNIRISPDTIYALQSFHLLAEGNEYQKALQKYMMDGCDDDGKFRCRLRTKDLDIIRAVLSSANMAPFHLPRRDSEKGDDEQLKKTIINLIDNAVRSNLREYDNAGTDQNLALIVYSATCHILSEAIREWKEQATTSYYPNTEYFKTNQVLTEEQTEYLLRKSLTVVTMGGLCKDYVDGPAYIHVSMYDDILASSLGVSENNSDRGGKDAVYLNGLSPYAPSTSLTRDKALQNNSKYDIYDHDAHNMDACAIQYLSLIRRINGVSSFRQMYEFANDEGLILDINSSLFAINYSSCKIGQLEMPKHLDDTLLPSMIRATGGERWLFNPSFQLGEEGIDGSESPLPTLCDAEAELTQQFGYDVYDEIIDACEVEALEE